MLRPNFVRSQIGDVLTFERHVSHLISKLPGDGKTPVNLADYFFRLTLDSATEFLFGESTNSLSQSSEESFGAAFDRGQSNIAMRARFGPLVKWLPFAFDVGSIEKDQKFVHDFVDYYVDKGCAERDQQQQQQAKKQQQQQQPQPSAVDEAKQKQSNSENERYIFITELIRQTPDRTRIRSELLNILLAGRDTTASLLTNLWWLLSKNPTAWAKLQTEISTLQGSHPTFETLKDLKYLRALLNETLRLYPVVPQNSREAQEDTVLPVGGGADGQSPLFVAKGSVVGWSVYAMHRRPEYYGPDAEEFRPERWLDDPATGAKGLRPGWEYLPFNGGARICLGQQFALTEASYTTVRLCQAFAGIESADPTDVWREKFTLTCVNLEGAKVVLTPR
jgi:cytochrome P450